MAIQECALDARPGLHFRINQTASGPVTLESSQVGTVLSGGSTAQNFHAMLRELCDEHDREVSALHREIALLQAMVSDTSSSASCQGSGAANEDSECPLVVKRRVLSTEQRHAAAQPEEAPRTTSDVAAPFREASERTSNTSTSKKNSSVLGRASDGRRQRGSRTNKAVFVDAHAMKEKIRQAAMRPEYNVADFYHREGLWRSIALHPHFEKITLGIIAFNALWIWIDTDWNKAQLLMDAAPHFQIMEYVFCVFFSFEWYVRFMSFAKKINCFRDFWFVFDSGLVIFMVLETWVMTTILFVVRGDAMGGNLAILRTARLLRLSRMTRMVRLFRVIPELLIMIKGMRAACRSVLFTLVLLGIILYVFGIAFTQMAGEDLKDKFGTVPLSMHTLLLDGTLLDSAGEVVRNLEAVSTGLVVLFYFFILLAALTVMNMLIGVLCEVVSAVAATEKETIHVAFMKGQLEKVWEQVAGSEDKHRGEISKEEFSMILQSVDACRALEEAGVDPIGLVDNIDFIFAGEVEDDDGNLKDKTLSFGDFVSLLLTMRGSNNATVKDMVDLRKFFKSSMHKLREDLRRASPVSRYVPHGFTEDLVNAMPIEVTPPPDSDQGITVGSDFVKGVL
mmetsp:Transcript_118855/g.296450  ORF Transcript_118855/g.296450 Transcript_118855/m.296450 type:complete len:621 (-) Transcript_118855:315-2177(-)